MLDKVRFSTRKLKNVNEVELEEFEGGDKEIDEEHSKVHDSVLKHATVQLELIRDAFGEI